VFTPAVTTGVKFDCKLGWGDDSLIKKGEESPFNALFDQTKLGEMQDIALDSYAVVSLSDLHEIFGGTGDRTRGRATVRANGLRCEAASACQNARLYRRDPAEQGNEF